MKITLNLQEFVNFATHNGLFDWVSILDCPSVIESIKQADPEHRVCFIEESNPAHPILWSTAGWIEECKRRQFKPEKTKDMLKIEIDKAIASGDAELAMALMKEMKAL